MYTLSTGRIYGYYCCLYIRARQIETSDIIFIETPQERRLIYSRSVGHTIFLISFLLLLTALMPFSLRCIISAEEGRGSEGLFALLLFCDSTWTAVVISAWRLSRPPVGSSWQPSPHLYCAIAPLSPPRLSCDPALWDASILTLQASNNALSFLRKLTSNGSTSDLLDAESIHPSMNLSVRQGLISFNAIIITLQSCCSHRTKPSAG